MQRFRTNNFPVEELTASNNNRVIFCHGCKRFYVYFGELEIPMNLEELDRLIHDVATCRESIESSEGKPRLFQFTAGCIPTILTLTPKGVFDLDKLVTEARLEFSRQLWNLWYSK